MGRDEPVGPPGRSWTDSGWVGAEPDDDLERRLAATEEPFDERQPHVVTALGSIEPAALGVTLIADRARPLTGGRDPGTVLLELEQAYAAGVRSIVDLASLRSAADLADLHWISARAPVHIIVAADLANLPVAPSGETVHVGAAIVNVGPAGRYELASSELPMFVRSDLLRGVEDAVVREGSSPGEGPVSIVLPEAALAADQERVPVLANNASLVLVVATDEVGTMSRAASVVRDLVVEHGFGERLALGYNSDPVGLMERFPVLLMEVGLPATAVRRLLVENPARALTRVPRPGG